MAKEGRDEKGKLPVYELKIDEDQSNFIINIVPESELIDPAFKFITIHKDNGKE